MPITIMGSDSLVFLDWGQLCFRKEKHKYPCLCCFLLSWRNALSPEPITQSFHLPYCPSESTLSRISLFLEATPNGFFEGVFKITNLCCGPPLLRPIYTVRLCCIRQAYDWPTTWIGLLQQTITWYKIRHTGGQAHYYSRTGTLKQRPVTLDWLRSLCFNVPVRE